MKANNTAGHEQQRRLMCGWLKSIGIDPDIVPMDGVHERVDERGDYIEVEMFPVDDDGNFGPRDQCSVIRFPADAWRLFAAEQQA